MAVDSLVKSLSAYVKRPLITHAYAGPFAFIYVLWLFYWSFTLGIDEWWEVGCIISVAIVLLQVNVALFKKDILF